MTYKQALSKHRPVKRTPWTHWHIIGYGGYYIMIRDDGTLDFMDSRVQIADRRKKDWEVKK